MLDWNTMMKGLQICGALLSLAGAVSIYMALRGIRRTMVRGRQRIGIRNRAHPILPTYIVRLISGSVMLVFGLILLINALNNRWPTF